MILPPGAEVDKRGGEGVSNTQYFTLFLVGMLMLMAMMIAAIAWLEYDGWQAVVIALPAIVLLGLLVTLVLAFTFA